jgi:hypothetical protein
MAWTATNPVSVGNPTKKKDYDKLWDNCDYIKTNVMSSGSVMLFAQAAPPTGWTRVTTWTPGAGKFTNIVYTTGACSTGGAGSPTSDIVVLPHNHQWYDHTANSSGRSYNSAGTVTLFASSASADDRKKLAMTTGAVANVGSPAVDLYTGTATPTASKTTAYRYIAVLAAQKDKYVP